MIWKVPTLILRPNSASAINLLSHSFKTMIYSYGGERLVEYALAVIEVR